MFSRFDRIPACDGQTDRRTDGHLVTAQSALSRGNNRCSSGDMSVTFCQDMAALRPSPMAVGGNYYNNNNIQDNIYGAVIMAEPLREFTRFI